MKPSLLIILFVLSILLSTMSFYPVFGPCIDDLDWPSAPCYPPGDSPPLEKLREEWMGYYDYKGKEWMEMKKLEMQEAIKNGTLEDWKKEGPPQAHSNVHFYYYVNGEVPDIDGKFADEYFTEEFTFPHDPYTDDERLRIASEKKFESEENMGGGSGMGFFDKSDFNLSTVIIAIPIGVGSALGLTYYLRKRK